jgi:hypothetical protein
MLPKKHWGLLANVINSLSDINILLDMLEGCRSWTADFEIDFSPNLEPRV